jgi:hypothetical protein
MLGDPLNWQDAVLWMTEDEAPHPVSSVKALSLLQARFPRMASSKMLQDVAGKIRSYSDCCHAWPNQPFPPSVPAVVLGYRGVVWAPDAMWRGVG